MATGQLFYDPVARPLSPAGLTMPGAYYNFYVSGTSNAAAVYQDAALTVPYPSQSLNGSPSIFTVITADGTGAFPLMFLNPLTIYRVQLYTPQGQLIEDVDPYVPAMPTTGNSQILATANGQFTIAAPIPGGTGVTLTINPRSGGQALTLVATAPGAATLVANNAVVVGTQTATFGGSNKPGAAGATPAKWLPIICDGSTYYIPLWL
jgi:hypothetical protein